MPYGLAIKLMVRILERVSGERKSGGGIRKLPLAAGWTDTRDLPTPTGRTLRELYVASKTHLG